MSDSNTLSESAPESRWAERCITVFGSGYAPFASGTWGSATAIVLFAIPALLLHPFPELGWVLNVVVLVPGIVLAVLGSVWWGEWALERFQSSDPKPFVLDEFAGQWVALLSLPLAAAGGGLIGLGALLFSQFFLFRLLDVIKPPPAAQLESLPAGWGVLCDDLMAGLYANIVGQIIWRYTPLATAIGLAHAGG